MYPETYIIRILCSQGTLFKVSYVLRALPSYNHSKGNVLQVLRMFSVHYIFSVFSGSYVMRPMFPVFPVSYTPRALCLLRVLCSQGPAFLNPYVPMGLYFQGRSQVFQVSYVFRSPIFPEPCIPKTPCSPDY